MRRGQQDTRGKIAAFLGLAFGFGAALAAATFGLSGGVDDAARSLGSSAAPAARAIAADLADLAKFRDMQQLLSPPASTAAMPGAAPLHRPGAQQSPVNLPAGSLERLLMTYSAGSGGHAASFDPAASVALVEKAAIPEAPPAAEIAAPSLAAADRRAMGAPSPGVFDPAAILAGAREVIVWLIAVACLIGFFVGFLASRALDAILDRPHRRVLRTPTAQDCRAVRIADPQSALVNVLPQARWVGQELENSTAAPARASQRARPYRPGFAVRRFLEI